MDTTKKRVAGKYPSLRVVNTFGDEATLDLTYYREKRDGDLEENVVRLNLSTSELACVGSQFRQTVWTIKEAAAKRMQADYDRIITPGR